MDALVHLSQREGLPRALPQAMAAGKPVISLNLDGAPEVCITGKTGYLLKEHIHDHLIQSLVELQQNPELRRNLGEQGRELVRKRFAISTMVDEIESLYWQLNGRKKSKK
jgi:glycosyltransferase involved in cell wall biosynthesis